MAVKHIFTQCFQSFWGNFSRQIESDSNPTMPGSIARIWMPSTTFCKFILRRLVNHSRQPVNVRRQAITWTSAGLLSIGLLGTNVSEIRRKCILSLSSVKMAAIVSRRRWVQMWTVRKKIIIHQYGPCQAIIHHPLAWLDRPAMCYILTDRLADVSAR